MGGYRLHINCTGTGSPTVVVEAGWGDMSASWGWVQPEVAKTTRICTYDRAGMGWSEASPQPRTAREYAKELHTLLTKANERGPYVLVGHSMGGFTVMCTRMTIRPKSPGWCWSTRKTCPLRMSLLLSQLRNPVGPPCQRCWRALAWCACWRILGSIQNLPEGDKQAYTAYAVAPRGVQTFTDEGMGMSEGGAQARAVTSLGALPLIVLSRGKDQDAKLTAAQADLLQLSTDSQQLFADHSGHRIMIEQPEAAVAAIVKMVSQLR